MKLLLEPYEYQKEGIEIATGNNVYGSTYTINAFSMGLGKTLVAIASAVKVDAKKTLIICPAFLKHNWADEIEKFTGERSSTTFSDKAKFHLVSYASISKVKDRDYEFIVCDEFHYAKNIKAIRTSRLHKLVEENSPKYFLGLSGTPIKNRIPEFWSLLRIIWYGGNFPTFKKYAKSQWTFNMKFSNKRTIVFGNKKITRFEGMKNISLLKEMIKPIYLRKKAEDELDLPEQVYKELVMKDSAKTDALLNKAWDAYEGGKDRKNFSSAKAVNALSKVDYTIEFLKEASTEVDRFVIFTDHVQVAQKLFNELGPEVSRFVTGSTKASARHQYVREINEGKIKYLISTIGSLSVGVNITGCSHMVFNDYPWGIADIEQAEKRIHRIGQKNTCFYYYILASKMDKKILTTLMSKKNLLDKLEM